MSAAAAKTKREAPPTQTEGARGAPEVRPSTKTSVNEREDDGLGNEDEGVQEGAEEESATPNKLVGRLNDDNGDECVHLLVVVVAAVVD